MSSAVAPFTQSQIDSINAYQKDPRNHPMTCNRGHQLPLVADIDGLRCFAPECPYFQVSVNESIANGKWKISLDYLFAHLKKYLKL